MSKEEILKYAKVFSEAKGDTYKIHFVNENKTINEPDLWKETLNLIDKLQKENDFLKAPFEYANGNTLDKRYVEMNFVSKDKIREVLKDIYFYYGQNNDMFLVDKIREELLG